MFFSRVTSAPAEGSTIGHEFRTPARARSLQPDVPLGEGDVERLQLLRRVADIVVLGGSPLVGYGNFMTTELVIKGGTRCAISA